MASLQTAGSALVTDLADVRVRGYLKEHPDIVAYGLDQLSAAIEEVRAAVDRERAAGKWGSLGADVSEEHDEAAAEYADHSCDCPFCLCGT
ncbi:MULTISPECIES: hypothetical protein [unclassified Streptomyces]|uniref:hypothetical protein n=1 Tax=unclassified Streptomyces TaxID=2593676 RepID=UPI002E3280F7|nr:hypothetical protein [Streptomyces sp. NBC_00691]